MSGFYEISLINMLNELGEDKVKSILSSFSCPFNKDIEDFLRHKAIFFARQGLTPTYLVYSDFKNKHVLVGYYAITMKAMYVSNKKISKVLSKRIAKFGTHDSEYSGYTIPAPLIAQLSKNFIDGYNKLISGDELLKLALDRISIAQQNLGGKIVYVECEEKELLIKFYEANGFVSFDKRPLDPDEKGFMQGDHLIQLLKYIEKDDKNNTWEYK